VAGRALRRVDLRTSLHRRRIGDILDLDRADLLQPRGDGLLAHRVAAGSRLVLRRHVVGEQDDQQDRHDERQRHRPNELLRCLDGAFVRQVVIVLVSVAHAVLMLMSR
jgi:hypothetical protein